ncbi:DegQ family serine endoprotease [Candidatus Magnetaquicoccus inordinatus]|uniref:DegQ family serine endoprotease n=1 Tax=Candidatus Magnetaquicoccus inordinatus TaxID=2496818 RepID=UPI001D0E9B7B|nr:DegQ family serine endoprotease [Candidatus Magnetaquicoccus inordinatus]
MERCKMWHGKGHWLPGLFALLTGLLCAVAGVVEASTLPDLVPLVKRLKPVVVNISTTHNPPAAQKGGKNPFPEGFSNRPLDELFRRFFDQMPQESQKSNSLGSGVIVDAAGYILTNNHVIADADNIQVRLTDDREFNAKVVGKDSKTDLALIRIEGAGTLPVAQLGDSDRADVGSWVIAIGNPFGLEATVTSGIISAKGRHIGSGPYDNFLQTDAAINPGNSGGPLFNLDGAVIGINTAIFSRSGGNMGIGFAIPINMAKSVMEQLKSHGRVTRGWLGVRIQSVTHELAKALSLDKRYGALVASVESGSPASAAGIQPGDVVIRFDGRDVGQMNELPAIVAETPIGKKVRIDLIRDGKAISLDVVVAELKEKAAEVASSSDKADASSFGASVRSLTPELREQLELEESVRGVVITAVEPGSSAANAGLRAKDVIAEINRKPIRDVADFRRALQNAKTGDALLILLFRGGEPLYLAVQLADSGK